MNGDLKVIFDFFNIKPYLRCGTVVVSEPVPAFWALEPLYLLAGLR